MKKITFILFATIFLALPFLSFGQEEATTKETTKTEKKVSYTFINEYGTYMGGSIGFIGVFVNGISIKKQDVIGIGVGYEVDTRAENNIPLYVNYRHYFPGKRALKPLVNFAIGTRLSFWPDYDYCPYCGNDPFIYPEPKSRVTAGLYATMAAGFRVKAFSFTSGFFMKSWNDEYFGGIEVKVGFTF